MADYLVQVSFQGSSGLPQDRFENTWAFNSEEVGPGTYDGAGNVAGRLIEFYAAATVGNPPVQYIDNTITAAPLIKVYDRAAAKPRPILFQTDFPLPGGRSAPPMPHQVACVLSFFALRNLPSQRGRIYFGPLNSGARDATTGNVSSALSDALLGGATQLQTTQNGSAGLALASAPPDPAVTNVDVLWCVYSRKGAGILRPVTDGWVDNSWDIQRRRKVDATIRTAFPLP